MSLGAKLKGIAANRTAMTKAPDKPLVVTLSPESFVRRDAAACAAALLADKVVSLLPGIKPEVFFDVRYPATREFAERFAWAVQLSEFDVVTFEHQGDRTRDAYLWMEHFARSHPAYGRLFGQDYLDAAASNESYVEFLCKQIVSNEPHIGTHVVLDAGMDAFALKHGLLTFGSRATGRPHGSMSVATVLAEYLVPVIRSATAEQILAAREILRDELHPLRLAIRNIADGCDPTDTRAVANAMAQSVLPRLEEYRSAFSSRKGKFLCLVDGIERDALTGLAALGAATFSGIPAITAAGAGLAITGVTMGIRMARQAAAQSDFERNQMFGFLARFEQKG
ncbi:hypothetical protein PHYC_02073 [Phycisphaerales bacterium]|nr:hypothetical protein PHYC_02073 [Phycisphaerales bacterium]